MQQPHMINTNVDSVLPDCTTEPGVSTLEKRVFLEVLGFFLSTY